MRNIVNAIEECMSVWSQVHGVPNAILLESWNKVMESVNNIITTLKE